MYIVYIKIDIKLKYNRILKYIYIYTICILLIM